MNPFFFRIVTVAIVCLVAGGAIGRFLLAPGPQKIIVRETVTKKPDFKVPESVYLKWTMASAFRGDTPQFGTLGKSFTAKLRRASAGAMQIGFAEPGQPIAAEKCFEAVIEGMVETCWSTPGYWTSTEKALALFSGVPFGPDAREYLAWYYYGGGEELLDEIYGGHGLKSVLCGVSAAEGGGWFREEIAGPGFFKGKKIRIFGLGARVVEKLGAIAVRLDAAELKKALEEGKIAGAEYSIPLIDLNMGLNTAAKFYYVPGWHKPATLLELLVRRGVWNGLADAAKAMIVNACGDTIREGLAEGASLQPAAIRELTAKGVDIRKFPDKVLSALEAAWQKVAEEESTANPLFKRVWRSLSSFRAEYRLWDDKSRVP